MFKSDIILRYTNSTRLVKYILHSKTNNLSDWIIYISFDWGLKKNNGDGIKNDTEYYTTKYTDLIFNDIMVSSENLPKWARGKFYSDRYKEAFRSIISLRNRESIRIIILEKYHRQKYRKLISR